MTIPYSVARAARQAAKDATSYDKATKIDPKPLPRIRMGKHNAYSEATKIEPKPIEPEPQDPMTGVTDPKKLLPADTQRIDRNVIDPGATPYFPGGPAKPSSKT